MQISEIKYRLLHQFYGIEEYMDMIEPLPCIIDALDDADSEFNLLLMIKELDIWFIRVHGKEQGETWSPFKEPLFEFAKRHALIVAHQYPDRQINDRDIISYTKQCQPA